MEELLITLVLAPEGMDELAVANLRLAPFLDAARRDKRLHHATEAPNRHELGVPSWALAVPHVLGRIDLVTFLTPV